MIVPMTKFSFIVLNGDKDNFLKKLQELQLVDITRSEKPIDDKSQTLMKRTEEISKVLNLLNKFEQESDQKPNIDISKNCELTSLYYTCADNLKQYEEKFDEFTKQLEIKKIWGDYNQNVFKEIEDRGYKVSFYHIDKAKFDYNWVNTIALHIVEETNKDIFFITIGEHNLNLKEVSIPNSSIEEIENNIEDYKNKKDIEIANINLIKENINSLIKEKDKNISTLDLYLANMGSSKYGENHIIVFEGFAPQEDTKTLCNIFDDMPIYYTYQDAKKDDNPPIKLKSNWFTRMFSGLTDMYGRPEYDEFDPTPYISIFFLLFFAMCMADAGYGIALVAIGIYLITKKHSLGGLVTTLGVGTAVVGYLFHTFLGMDMYEWSFLPDICKKVMITGKISGYDMTMVVAIVIGIIHLCLAMIVKTVYATKKEGFLNSLGTYGWTTLIVGTVSLTALLASKVINLDTFKLAEIILAIPSCICIFLLNNIKRNPLINIGSGLWDTYNTVTGLLGDILSYLRLYALGLAGGMLGKSFNDIAMNTIGGHFELKFQLIFFFLIFIAGHLLNLAMCCLGAFVHPLRLNFLEFFKNSGYSGQGKNYRPLK